MEPSSPSHRNNARKRASPHTTDNPGESQQSKRRKTQEERDLEAREAFEAPPEFYDRLSSPYLNRRMLAELERRTQLPRPGLERPRSEASLSASTRRRVRKFARHGGPNLLDIRGFLPPPGGPPVEVNRAPSPSEPQPVNASDGDPSMSSRGQQPNQPPVEDGSGIPSSRRSSPYDANFGQHLTDHNIHAWTDSEEPLNLDEIEAALPHPLPPEALSADPGQEFRAFRRSSARAKDEADVLRKVMPTILGPESEEHPCAGNVVLGNFERLTDGTISLAKPDLYYGADPRHVSRVIRQDLESRIVPSVMQDRPVIPNFFVEVKGPFGVIGVLERQARYSGALGARAMHALQNYNQDQQTYDGRAYTLTATYNGGLLDLYAHHVTAPPVEGGEPVYHMTPVGSWTMKGRQAEFDQAIRAFRNARDLAKRYRDGFIAAANAAVAQRAAGVA